MPTLAERKEDLPLLERHFISKFSTQYRKQIRGLTHRAQILLSLHGWPGNVREVENVIGHACMMAMGEMIDVPDLPGYLHSTGEATEAAAGNSATPHPEPGVGTLEEQERLLIIRALEAAGGNQSLAARLLRIGRDALRYKLKKHNL